MNRIVIDFAPQSWWRSLAQTGLRTWFALLLGLALCVSAGLAAQRILSDIDTDHVRLKKINLQLSERSANKPVPKKLVINEAQETAVNAAIAQLNLPWRDVLNAVESATPKTVALLALEPDAKRNIVKGVAEAKTSDDMIAYIEQLKKQDFLQTVLLTKHEINEQDPNKPLRFQFEAQWSGATP